MRRLIAITAAVTVAAGALAAAPGQAATDPGGFVVGGTAGGNPPEVHDVTLVTGDRLQVQTLADGRRTVAVTPAPRDGGATPSFVTTERDGALTVVPEDVRELVGQVLDPALFNVSELIAQGYSDDDSDTLPLIVEDAAAAVPAAETTAQLESIDAVGVRLDKEKAGELGRAISALAAGRDGAGARSTGPLAGVDKIWLDRRVEVSLDRSTAQVGADAAWDVGLYGSGVTVAVLDTGIDSTHPDLADAVVAERNFTFDPDAVDHHGHGTHVASIVAGSGAASDGDRRGVSSGVELVNGKVLNDLGFGFASSIIDGMEWAATEADADVVNMSLGVRGFGSDPVAAAVQNLTAAEGALFVVAAGNDGCVGCVGTPGTAASALTVGAVDRDDVLAEFSSRGPMPGDSTIKPDLTAPGVGIAAARAAGTGSSDDAHQSMSGTSMSTPHVAGAAALLLQSRPGSTPVEVKSWLMGSAVPSAGTSVYAQGAGRVDVGRALDQDVLSTPGSLSLGFYSWPHTDRPASTHQITYRNVTGTDVQLSLTVELTDADAASAPASVLSVPEGAVTVPANGTAVVPLTLDTASGRPGLFGGAVVARTPDGTEVRTPVGFEQESERVEVRLRGIDRKGEPAQGFANVMNIQDGTTLGRNLAADPEGPCSSDPGDYGRTTCVRVAPGTYSVMAYIDTMPAFEQTGPFVTELNKSLVGYPEMEITEDTEIVLDARKATEVLVDTPDHETKRNLGAATHIMYHRAPVSGPALNLGFAMYAGEHWEERLFMQPTDEVTTGEFSAYTRWRLEAPEITLEVTSPEPVELTPQYYRPAPFSDVSREFPRLEGELETRVVDAGTATDADLAELDLTGAVALVRRSDELPVAEQSNNAAAAGAAMVAIHNDVPGVNANPWPASVRLSVPTVWMSHEDGERVLAQLAAGDVEVAAEGITASPYLYDLVYAENGSIPASLTYGADTTGLARVDTAFHSQASDEVSMAEARYQFQPWEAFSIASREPVTGAPRERVDYLVPGPDTAYNQAVSTPEPAYNNIWPHEPTAYVHLGGPGLRTFEAGERSQQSWFGQPLMPGTDPFRPVSRQGDVVEVAMAAVDGAGNFGDVYTSMFDRGLTTELRVYEGEEYLGGTQFLPVGWFVAAPEPTEYRVEFDVANDSEWASLSTETKSAWTFTSAPPSEGETRVEPMLEVDYDLDVDLQNRALAPRDRRGPQRIGLTVGHPAGAPSIPVEAVSLDISYDDGASWDSLKVSSQGDGRYETRLDSRPRSGFASLRLSAVDAEGNSVEQEVIRAYAIPGR